MAILENTLITIAFQLVLQGFKLFGAETTILANTGSSKDVSAETTTECLASLLRQQGLKTSGKVFWSELNIFGFVLSLVWIPKPGSGSNPEEGEHLSVSMDSVSRRWITSTISL